MCFEVKKSKLHMYPMRHDLAETNIAGHDEQLNENVV